MNASESSPLSSSPVLAPSGAEAHVLFQQLAETLPQLVWTTGPDGHADYFNPRWYEYTGLAPGRPQGEGWLLAVHPEDLPEARRRWQHALRTGEPYEAEVRCQRHDGVYRWFLGRAQPRRDADGRISRWFGTCTDIEEQKRQCREAQEALQRKEEEQHLAASIHRVGQSLAAETEPVRLVKAVTEAVVSLTGASFGAFLETRVEENGEPSRLSTLPLPRATPLFASTFHGEPPVLLDDVTHHPEYGKHTPFQSLSARHLPVRSYLGVAVKGRSGEVLGGLFLVHPEPGRFTRAHAQLAEGIAAQLGVALDTARLHANARQAEERFGSLLHATVQAVWVTRSDGLVVEDSPSWRAFTGQTFEDYRGFGSLAAVHPEDQERVRRGWEAGRALKRPYELEMRVRRADGSWATVVSRSVPLFAAPGEVREWIGTTLDITDQRHAEEVSRRLESEQRSRQLEVLRSRVSQVLAGEDTPERMMQACAEVLTRSLPAFPLVQLWTWDKEAKQLSVQGHSGPPIPPTIQKDRLALGEGFAGTVAQGRQSSVFNDLSQHPAVRVREWWQMYELTSFLGIPLQVRGQLVGVLTLFGMQVIEDETLITLSTVAEAVAQGLERRRAELRLAR